MAIENQLIQDSFTVGKSINQVFFKFSRIYSHQLYIYNLLLEKMIILPNPSPVDGKDFDIAFKALANDFDKHTDSLYYLTGNGATGFNSLESFL